jgi:Secretion system C-terminal sorting domain
MRRFWFMLLFTLLSMSSIAQKIRFTDSTNVWQYNYFSSGLIPPFFWGPNSDYYSGTSIIGGREYKQLGHGSYGVVFVREDTILNKVYAIMPIFGTDTGEKLLYDYSLNVGDTFRNQFNIFYVHSIDSMLVGTIWCRVWNFLEARFGYPLTIIEGVGSIIDPCAPISPGGFEGGNLLTCFSTHGASPAFSPAFGPYYLDVISPGSYILDNSTSCSYNFVALQVPENKMSEGVLFPNPVKNELSISYPVTITSLSIINLFGQQVYTHEYNADKVQIDVADLPTGVYFVRINGTEVRRFVKE